MAYVADKPAGRDSAEGSPVRVSQHELIRSSGDARRLSLDALRVRARKGGQYLSHFKGRGMEFDEARPYQDGDDPRHIDWRVTARTGRPYTKLFREERERPVLLAVDLRAAMHFATRGVFKSVLAARLATLLAWAAVQRGDRLGGFVFSEAADRELRPRLGRRAVLGFIHELATAPGWTVAGDPAPAQSEAAAQGTLAGLRRVARPGSLIAIFSDFRDLDEGAMKHLAAMGRHNDVLAFFVHDRLERQLPPAGVYPVAAPGASFTIATGRRRVRAAHRRAFDARRERMQALCRQHDIRWIETRTEDEPLAVLAGVVGARPR